jgi:hypothetical protein
MTSAEFTEKLHDLLYGIDEAIRDEVVSYRTFADAGLFTNDAGLVVRLADGTEYQLTVVRSR